MILNDVQPSLVKLLAETTLGNTNHFIHAPRGIHAKEDSAGVWSYYMQDGLGSVRNDGMSYDPYGNSLSSYGAGYLYAGEQIDSNGLSYNRARYYSPDLAQWISQDFLEVTNRFAYVDNNPISRIDPTGLDWTDWLADLIRPIYEENRVVVSFVFINLMAPSVMWQEINDPCNRQPEDYTNLWDAQGIWFREMGIRFVSEPHDWGYTLNDWRQGNYNHLDWLGFLPLVPAVNAFRRTQVDEVVQLAIEADIQRANQIANIVPATSIQIESIPRTLLPDNSRLFYRGQAFPTDAILSPIARQSGLSTSENLYNLMLRSGFRKVDIAHIAGSGMHGDDLDAIVYPDDLLPQFRAPLSIDPRLGNVGIPTSLNPAMAAHFGKNDGVVYVIHVPNQNNLSSPMILPVPVPATNRVFANVDNIALQLGEEEWMFFNQIPNEYIIGSIDLNSIPRLRVNSYGKIVIGQ